MVQLTNISNTTTWNTASNAINENNSKIAIEIQTLKNKIDGNSVCANPEYIEIKASFLTANTTNPTSRNTASITIPTFDYMANKEDLLNSTKYRFIIMRWRRRAKYGYSWRVPMFGFDTNGNPKDPSNGFTYDGTWWAISGKTSNWWNGNKDFDSLLLPTVKRNTKKQTVFASYNKREMVGVAIFRYEGTYGSYKWRRVSNIAKIMMQICGNKVQYRIIE